MENQTYEQEVDLKDLILAILRRWRSIIVVGILMAVVMGGYAAVSGSRAGAGESEDEQTYEDALALYESEKTGLEMEIENLEMTLKGLSAYQENSLLMKISPYNKPVASAEVYIDAADSQVMRSLAKAYTAVLKNENTLEKLYQILPLEDQYLLELFSVDSYLQGMVTVEYAADSSTVTSTYYGEDINMLSIKATAGDQETAGLLLEALLGEMESSEGELAASIGPHTLNVVDEGISAVVDMELAKKQQDNRDSRSQLTTALENSQTAYDELEEPAVPSAGGVSMGRVLKYVVLGGAVGVFLMAFAYCVVYLMSDKIHSEKDLKSRFGIKILGVMPGSGVGEHTFFIDQWLYRLEGRNCSGQMEPAYDLAAANLKNYAGEAKNLLLTGTVGEEQMKELAQSLSRRLPGFVLTVGKNMAEDVDTRKKLPDCDGVILVEKAEASRAGAVQQEIEMIGNVGKEIVGAVVI